MKKIALSLLIATAILIGFVGAIIGAVYAFCAHPIIACSVILFSIICMIAGDIYKSLD